MKKITQKSKTVKEVSKVGSESADGSATEAGTAAEERQDQTPESATPTGPLSPEEMKTRDASELTITQNVRGGWELAEALTKICKGFLYRDKYSSFKEYCPKRWRLSHCRARQLINALVVRKHLGETCGTEKLPETECQVRPLTPLRKDLDLQVKAWESAWSTANGQPTGDQVKEAVKALASRKPYRSREEKVAGALRGLKAYNTVITAKVDPKAAELLKKLVKRLTVLNKS